MTRWSHHLHDILPALLLLAVASGPATLTTTREAYPVVTEPTTPNPDTTHVDAGDGTHLHPDRVAARYTVISDCWTDMPEARPRARARVSEGEQPAVVTIDVDGEMHWAPASDVVIDRYEGDGYEAVRAEGEARWAAIDEQRAEGGR